MAGRKTEIIEILLNARWGGQALICLYVSILSGIILALQYSPAEPFYSSATLELIVPYGRFWRSLHFYSSQAFFLLLLVHLAVILYQKGFVGPRGAWLRLMSSLPIGLLLLFTGYVLRGDATGEAAGAIAEHISLSIPGAGQALNRILFDITATGMRKVYANHMIGLMVLGMISLWPHLRRYPARFSQHGLGMLAVLLPCLCISAPMEPARIGMTHIAGPWFFLGLQELLRTVPPFWAGVAVPASVMAILFMYPESPKRQKTAAYAILLWCVVYSVLTLISLYR
jgi:ubiquinol-cytochrome c reductase cytochrome b subunit